LDEKAEILMVERGPYVSYANCGLPYHVGGVIEKESSLLVANEQLFRAQFAIDCRTRCEVVGISSKKKTVELKNHVTGEVTTEKYDKLVLSPGAASVHPPLPGIDLPGIFHVRTVPDARAIRENRDKRKRMQHEDEIDFDGGLYGSDPACHPHPEAHQGQRDGPMSRDVVD
jgi:NADPH-dependent 2,4-dienoyl-CoA reductase/sulfur reductase-like enzyme